MSGPRAPSSSPDDGLLAFIQRGAMVAHTRGRRRMMGPQTIQDLLDEVGALHRKYKLGALAPDDLERYRTARSECARVVTDSQNRALRSRQKPRRLRVSRSVPVRI